MVGILGKKLGMTQLFQADGSWVPVTVVQAGPCRVLQVKVTDTAELPEEQRDATTNLGKRRGKQARARRADGYYAVQLGFADKTAKAANQAEKGHAARAGTEPKVFVREFRSSSPPECKRGDEIKVDVLKDAGAVDVIGITKGRGFAGTIKRYGFQRQRMTHGNSKHHRSQGSLGRNNSIAKGVPKGKRMCGHLGVEQVTIQNLKIVKIDTERHLVFLRGAIPGHRSGYVVLSKTIKSRKSSK